MLKKVIEFEVEFPEKGGNSIIVSNKDRDLKLVFTYQEPVDLDNNTDFYINDIVKQMNKITDQYDAINLDLFNDNEVE